VPERNRDESVEHVLRRVLSQEVRESPQGACLDGETLAAWTEGSLRADEAAVVERHVADCGRCRSLMAAFIQTTPPAPAVESVWHRWRLGWVVPLATAATAAALWIALPGNNAMPVSVPSIQEVNTAPVGQTSRDAAPPAAPSTSPESFTRSSAPQERVAVNAGNELRKRANQSAARLEELSDERAAADAALLQRVEADKRESAPSAASPSPARADAATAGAATAGAAPRPLTSARQANLPLEIVAPGGAARWRITNGQRVEWSTAGATDWSPATITSSDTLTGGSASSASVCWVVGQRGAVYVTTDGTRFVRLPFPEMADLVSVIAIDDRSAMVSAADGRSWRTADQGLTWSMR